MKDSKYSTKATFTSVNGTEIGYKSIFQSAEKQIDYAVKCGYLSYEDGEDAKQEAALKILKSVKGYDETRSPKGCKYGYRVADSCCKNAWVTRNTNQVDCFSEHERVDEEGNSWSEPQIAMYRANEFNPERDLESATNVSFIWTTINALEGSDKVIAKMLIQHAKPEAMAEVLGCSAETAAVRVHRVRKALELKFHNLLDEFGMSRKKTTRYTRCQAA